MLSDNADASYISKGLVDGARKNIQLLLSRQLHEVYRITGNTDGQLRILFGIFHCIFQQRSVEYVDIQVLSAFRSKVTPQQLGQIIYAVIRFFTQRIRRDCKGVRDTVADIFKRQLGNRRK